MAKHEYTGVPVLTQEEIDMYTGNSHKPAQSKEKPDKQKPKEKK